MPYLASTVVVTRLDVEMYELSNVSSYVGMTSSGMRYSNIEPLHESSAGRPPDVVSNRPRRNQWSTGTSFLATAMKLANANSFRETAAVLRLTRAAKRNALNDPTVLGIEAFLIGGQRVFTGRRTISGVAQGRAVVLSACPMDLVPINGPEMIVRDVHATVLPAGG